MAMGGHWTRGKQQVSWVGAGADQAPGKRKPEKKGKEADSQQQLLAIAGSQLAIVWAERAVSLAGWRFSAQPSGLCA